VPARKEEEKLLVAVIVDDGCKQIDLREPALYLMEIDAPASFSYQEGIANFEPEKAWHKEFGIRQFTECRIGRGRAFIGKEPAGRNGAVHNERQLSAPFVTPLKNLVDCNSRLRQRTSPLLESANRFRHPARCLLVSFRRQPRNDLPVAGDIDHLAALDIA
jgi:hypothetical protein